MRSLEEHMREQIAKVPLTGDLAMLDQAADSVRRAKERAAESEARAQRMVAHAQAELKLVERLLNEAETKRIDAEREQRRIEAKLEEAEKSFTMREELIRQQLSAEENIAKAAEDRARELEEELETLRTALRSFFGNDAAASENVAAE
jgi:chromosome segregation ATPase